MKGVKRESLWMCLGGLVTQAAAAVAVLINLKS